jgi:cytochrome P450
MGKGRKGANHQARRELVKPPTLTPDQAKLWDTTVSAQSTAWVIAGMEPLLHAYVVSAVYLLRLYQKREHALADPDSDAKDITAYDDSITSEQRNLTALMRALRLTPQSRVHKESAKDRPPMPWDVHPEDDGDTA